MPDTDLAADVTDELHWDPKLDSDAIAVSADDGRITLRGTVGTLREKFEARKAAERVLGVALVDNQLQVQPVSGRKRDDAELRGNILQAMMLDSLVPSTVDVKVDEGLVTLTGTAQWQYQRDEAEHVASNIAGALDVDDDIQLAPQASAHDVKEGIESAIKRNAKLDAEALDVSTSDGTVTIKGTVSSWAEHDQALEAAWAAPGVTSVQDGMTVQHSARDSMS